MAVGVGDVLRIACQWFWNLNDEMVNVHHLVAQNIGSAADDVEFMELLAVLLEEELYDLVYPQMVAELVPSLITGFNLTKNEVLPPTAWVGTLGAGTDGLPPQVCPLVYLNGVQPRRQGRIYIPGFDETTEDDAGEWASGAVTALAAFGLALLDPMTSGGITVQRCISNADGSDFFFPTQAGFPTSSRTQRRRTKGRGS